MENLNQQFNKVVKLDRGYCAAANYENWYSGKDLQNVKDAVFLIQPTSYSLL